MNRGDLVRGRERRESGEVQSGSKGMSRRGWREERCELGSGSSALSLRWTTKLQTDKAHLELDETLCDWDRLSEKSGACWMRQGAGGREERQPLGPVLKQLLFVADSRR